jgi:perosamine synthetase
MGTLSFNGNKTITTGGGGAIITENNELARHAKHLTTTAKTPHHWKFWHDEIGYNYRMPNLNAAIGCAQLEQLPGFLSAKRLLFKRYREAFSKVRGITLVEEPSNCHSNYWLQTALLGADHSTELESLLLSLNNAGFMSRPAWVLMNELPAFRGCPAMDLAEARNLSGRLINIPSSSNLVEAHA